jgi:hypothetical protein
VASPRLDRAQAERARAILHTLSGWTSARIADAFGVREDTVRLWPSEFMAGGIDAGCKGGIRPCTGESAGRAQSCWPAAQPTCSRSTELDSALISAGATA